MSRYDIVGEYYSWQQVKPKMSLMASLAAS